MAKLAVLCEMENRMWNTGTWNAFPTLATLAEKLRKSRGIAPADTKKWVKFLSENHSDDVIDLVKSYGCGVCARLVMSLYSGISFAHTLSCVLQDFQGKDSTIVGSPPSDWTAKNVALYRAAPKYAYERNGVPYVARSKQPTFTFVPQALNDALEGLDLPTKVVPIANLAKAPNNQCLANSYSAYVRYGGKIVLGYMVSEAPHHFELIGHAVWMTPKGDLVDPTKVGNFKKTYFVAVKTTTDPDDAAVEDLFTKKITCGRRPRRASRTRT